MIKQKKFSPPQIYVALSWMTSLDSLYLIGKSDQKVIKVDNSAFQEYSFMRQNCQFHRVKDRGAITDDSLLATLFNVIFLSPNVGGLFCWCQHYFLQKISFFLVKIVSLLKAIVWGLRWRLFSSAFTFCKAKATIFENISFTDYVSGIQLLHCSKLFICRKNDLPTWRNR